MEKPGPKNKPDIVWILSDRQRAGIGVVVLLALAIGSCVASRSNNTPVPKLYGEHSNPNYDITNPDLQVHVDSKG